MEIKGKNVRNFVIIAHIDHGKSTLADRFLELTETVAKSKLTPQYLDGMSLEKEHGITIKMHPVQMCYKDFVLNLIDTPGHVDFAYEVSRALAAVEGAILLVDGTQGIQAQTLSNLQLAKEQNLKIVGAINKIDLGIPDLAEKKKELAELLVVDTDAVVPISAKSGENADLLLQRIVDEVPPPATAEDKPFRALIFDSHYDYYKGVIAYVRIVEGRVQKGNKIVFAASRARGEAVDLGYFAPELKSREALSAGEIGWIATGLKDPSLVRVGDTMAESWPTEILPGYEEPKPMVFAGFYLANTGQDFENFRYSLSQLKLNDSALYFTPENSEVLGRGYRLGFLGMLHLKITQERLKNEYGLDLIITHPTVPYRVMMKGEKTPVTVTNPGKWPAADQIVYCEEPWVTMKIMAPVEYLSPVLQLVNDARGEEVNTLSLSNRLIITCEIPLEEVIKDFYDNLKSVSAGYASMNYEISGYKKANLEKLEVLLAGKEFPSLSRIIFEKKAEKEARQLAVKLKNILPRQNYPLAIQVSAFGRVIARETLSAMKKDVTAHLYGGDRSRKMKLWKKQQKGKKKLRDQADLQVPPDVFLKIFSKSE